MGQIFMSCGKIEHLHVPDLFYPDRDHAHTCHMWEGVCQRSDVGGVSIGHMRRRGKGGCPANRRRCQNAKRVVRRALPPPSLRSDGIPARHTFPERNLRFLIFLRPSVPFRPPHISYGHFLAARRIRMRAACQASPRYRRRWPRPKREGGRHGVTSLSMKLEW